MKFGKLQDISQVDFSLPDDPDFNSKMLENVVVEKELPKVFIGCTGWGMKEWVGTVYPKNAKTKDYLFHYAKQFNTIELNTTHYRTPNEKTIEKWRTESAKDFRFCPKILQGISHSRDLGVNGSLLFDFCNAIAGLDEKLGCCFIQLPPYFGVDRILILEAFLEKFPSQIPLAVEVRHESWFENQGELNQLLECLNQNDVSVVITDVAGRRDVCHMGLTNETTMIRFVGNGLHETDYTRIDEWVDRLNLWFEKGLKEVYFFTHEPDNIWAPQLSVYLLERLQKYANVEVRGPELLDSNEGEQMTLF